MNRRIVSHTLSSLTGSGLDGLDPSVYSLMKHGHLPSIRALADQLTQRLVTSAPALLDPNTRVALPVAYLCVLPACGYIAQRVAENLRSLRPAHAEAVRTVRIAKNAVTSIDYASSTLEQRREQLDSLEFSLDEPVNGELVVLVDDIRITGLAERAAVKVLDEARPREVITAYIAAATPELALDPSVERRLNHTAVHHPGDLLTAMLQGEFALTIRYLKWLLAHPDLEALLPRIPPSVREELASGAAASGLWGRPEFARAHSLLGDAATEACAAGGGS